MSLGEAIRYMIKDLGLEEKVWQAEAKEAWFAIMGAHMEQYTTRIKVEKGKMIIQLTSSELKNEMSYHKKKIIQNIQEEMKNDYIKEIQFI
ncbi:unnamed protein product [Cyprideis torosa]|uniref:Uncharacterized protein n=1 Tax=Cyprideis torosa TaxID=163714 RepID=A0A7R8WQQ1_9CRUS|nr:unnamed protein product [Cyprideis torosa]CAG0902721.1 unnamed protein product [Cyprideis torosa]